MWSLFLAGRLAPQDIAGAVRLELMRRSELNALFPYRQRISCRIRTANYQISKTITRDFPGPSAGTDKIVTIDCELPRLLLPSVLAVLASYEDSWLCAR